MLHHAAADGYQTGEGVQDRRVHTRRTVEVFVTADLDTLLIALYVELTDAL